MRLLEHLAAANKDANPQLMRLTLKLATGAGKTTVMAMLIAWQTVNAVRHPGSKHFTHGFLVCTPGLTIKDRLRVLQPNDPDSYYASRERVAAVATTESIFIRLRVQSTYSNRAGGVAAANRRLRRKPAPSRCTERADESVTIGAYAPM
jgi:hypothetical protein